MDPPCYCTEDADGDFELFVHDTRVSTSDCSNVSFPLTCAVHFLCPLEGNSNGYHDIQIASSDCCPDSLDIKYPTGKQTPCLLKSTDPSAAA